MPAGFAERSGCPRPRRRSVATADGETSEHADTDVADVATASRFGERPAEETFPSRQQLMHDR